MSTNVDECIRLGRWSMRGHVPPFPPGDAPDEPHAVDCNLCGDCEYRRRRNWIEANDAMRSELDALDDPRPPKEKPWRGNS